MAVAASVVVVMVAVYEVRQNKIAVKSSVRYFFLPLVNFIHFFRLCPLTIPCPSVNWNWIPTPLFGPTFFYRSGNVQEPFEQPLHMNSYLKYVESWGREGGCDVGGPPVENDWISKYRTGQKFLGDFRKRVIDLFFDHLATFSPLCIVDVYIYIYGFSHFHSWSFLSF